MGERPNVDLSDDLLEEIGRTMRTDIVDEEAFWLDLVERKVLITDKNDHVDYGGGDEPEDDRRPAWQREAAALARAIDRDTTGRYLHIPIARASDRLREFRKTLSGDLWDAVDDAMRGGKGAYRRVRGVLQRRRVEHLWHEFETRQDIEDARHWLRREGVLPDDGKDEGALGEE